MKMKKMKQVKFYFHSCHSEKYIRRYFKPSEQVSIDDFIGDTDQLDEKYGVNHNIAKVITIRTDGDLLEELSYLLQVYYAEFGYVFLSEISLKDDLLEAYAYGLQ